MKKLFATAALSVLTFGAKAQEVKKPEAQKKNTTVHFYYDNRGNMTHANMDKPQSADTAKANYTQESFRVQSYSSTSGPVETYDSEVNLDSAGHKMPMPAPKLR